MEAGFSSLIGQLLNGLAGASSLFLVAAGLSLIFGVTRIVNFAHGSFYMLGLYVAYTLVERLSGSVNVLGRQFPSYDLFLMVVGPVVLGLLWLLLTRTRWGTLVRAATQDREMVSALGVNQAWLFTAVFALGALLAGLGGALQLPREPATLEMDLNTIGAAFVVVVVGGMGSIPGAYVAALLIAEIKAICIWLGVVDVFGLSVSFSKLTLVVDFLVMAVVLVWRPWGLMGKPQSVSRAIGLPEAPLRASPRGYQVGAAGLVLVLMALPAFSANSPYLTVLMIDLLIAALFAASLHFIMGPAGMHSFGHAAYFGLGAYGAALLVRSLGLPMELALVVAPLVAAAGAFVYGWFAVRLSGVYLAMLTLAFAQITWAITYQWDSFTGGSNGLTGVWPAAWLADKRMYYWLTLVLVGAGVWWLRRVLFSPFGYALRAGRDSVLRADAIGIDVKRMQWAAFVVAGTAAGLAGALYAFSKGSISPESLSVGKSVDGLVMVLLGGIQTLAGPVVGAVTFTWLHDTVARNTDYWRAMLGAIILILVLLFPQGIAGTIKQIFDNMRDAKNTKEGTA